MILIPWYPSMNICSFYMGREEPGNVFSNGRIWYGDPMHWVVDTGVIEQPFFIQGQYRICFKCFQRHAKDHPDPDMSRRACSNEYKPHHTALM